MIGLGHFWKSRKTHIAARKLCVRFGSALKPSVFGSKTVTALLQRPASYTWPKIHLCWRHMSRQSGPILQPTWLQFLVRYGADVKLVEKIVKHDSWHIQPDIPNPPLLRLTSRKPLWIATSWHQKSMDWRHNWKSAQVVNSHLVCDPTIHQPGFDLPRQQWSLLNPK